MVSFLIKIRCQTFRLLYQIMLVLLPHSAILSTWMLQIPDFAIVKTLFHQKVMIILVQLIDRQLNQIIYCLNDFVIAAPARILLRRRPLIIFVVQLP